VKNTDVAEDAAHMLDFFLNLGLKTAGEGNMLVSPLSALAALSMTANGAKGETLAQMEQVLGMDIADLNSWMHSYMESLPDTKDSSMKLANSLWFTDSASFTPAESFLKTNADYYGAGVFRTKFDAAALTAINNWVSAHTNDMIRNILDQIPENAVMYLVNALAFDAAWESAYEEHQVRPQTFTCADGTETEVTMLSSEESAYLEDDWATVFIKYYKGRDYAFVALLPKEGMTPAQYLEKVSGESLHGLLSAPEDIKVFANMPKFEMGYSVELSEVLQNLGMTDAFDTGLADFSRLGNHSKGNLCINRVLHKTFISVAEQGTRAGAATVVEVAPTAAPPGERELKEVILDRPFVYMIWDMGTDTPVFIGTLMDVQ
jgi:serpin B